MALDWFRKEFPNLYHMVLLHIGGSSIIKYQAPIHVLAVLHQIITAPTALCMVRYLVFIGRMADTYLMVGHTAGQGVLFKNTAHHQIVQLYR